MLPGLSYSYSVEASAGNSRSWAPLRGLVPPIVEGSG